MECTGAGRSRRLHVGKLKLFDERAPTNFIHRTTAVEAVVISDAAISDKPLDVIVDRRGVSQETQKLLPEYDQLARC